MKRKHEYIRVAIQTEDKFALRGGECLVKNAQITSDKTIELYNLSFFECQNSKLSALTIYLPYRENVSFKDCQFVGDVVYLDAKHKDTHALVSYRFFEDGRFLIDEEAIKESKIVWKPRRADNKKECELPFCKLMDGIPHDKYYRVLEFDSQDDYESAVRNLQETSEMIGERNEDTHTEM